jgi:hypothetical protein
MTTPIADGVRGETAAWGAKQVGSERARLAARRLPISRRNSLIRQIVSVAVELWKMPGQPTWSLVLTLVAASSKRLVQVNTLVL